MKHYFLGLLIMATFAAACDHPQSSTAIQTLENKIQQGNTIPVTGHKFKVDFGVNVFELNFTSDREMTFTVLKGDDKGTSQTVAIDKTEIRPNVYMITWQEKNKATVTHVDDFEKETSYTNITMPDRTFIHLKGTLTPLDSAGTAATANVESSPERNRAIVIDFLDKAFNKNDVQGAAANVTDEYIQHNPFVPTGKEGFIKGITAFHNAFPKIKWELKHIYTDGDFVITHSLYNEGKENATVDIFRLKDGKIDEHWDVTQEIPPADKMAHKNGMF